MRGSLLLAAILVVAQVPGAIAQQTGVPSIDPRQLNFQLFEAAKKGRTTDVALYLKHGASIKARDRFGNTALLLAAMSGRAKTVKLLLDAGSAVNQRNLGGSTALLRAAKAGKRKSVELLLATRADVKLLNNKRLSPL
ncbi:MAG: ankyrin repeat domain-containing protein, partial [Proteobacteria bacterium]|nr:ankyrin repeat domain-containing protein [Pseudomonadota bacterium]